MATLGRPPSANPRRHAIPVRLADNELTAIREAAERAGVTVGEWLRTKAVAAAKRQR